MKLEYALSYIKQGWAVFPCVPNTKVPITENGFKDASKSEDQVRRWWTEHSKANIGIATGQISGIDVVDVDVKKGAKGRESLNSLKGITPTLTSLTPSGGWHLYYSSTGPRGCRAGILPGIDLRADGGYAVAPGSEINGAPYRWVDPKEPISALPNAIVQLDSNRRRSKASPLFEGSVFNNGMRNQGLTSIAGTLRRRGLEFDEILAALNVVNVNRCSPPLSDDEVARIAASVAKYRSNNQSDASEYLLPDFAEDSLALEFSKRHSQDWRYVASWGSWLQWNGQCWKTENTYKAFDLARQVCREASGRCDKAGSAAKIASASTVAAVERLARASRVHAAVPTQWDLDPWLLNTQGGVVDLRTGEISPGRQDAYLTKITTAKAGNSTRPTRWLAFLDEVTNGDKELQAYLARVVGYVLTGTTQEHVLFFFYGTGANGKSVFLNILSNILGDYATIASINAFMDTGSDRHPTDLASLRGARLVTSIEVENGRHWAEAKIKTLTGGDKISARFMRQDFFEYQPQFKLLIAGNHKPGLRDVDEAMRRRLHLIPFTVTIPPAKRDKDLSDKLLSERDGILAWAIAGCLEWQARGLMAPDSVLSATKEYFSDEDVFQRWLDDTCKIEKSATAGTTQLFASWKSWAESCEEFVGSVRRFSDSLSQRGFSKVRESGSGRQGFRGIGLKNR